MAVGQSGDVVKRLDDRAWFGKLQARKGQYQGHLMQMNHNLHLFLGGEADKQQWLSVFRQVNELEQDSIAQDITNSQILKREGQLVFDAPGARQLGIAPIPIRNIGLPGSDAEASICGAL